MIRLDNVSVHLPGETPEPNAVLQDLTLRIDGGEWVALVGRNGSGKSTLLRTIARVTPLSHGTMDFGGDPPRTALLFQEPDNQFVSTSVWHELELSVPDGSVPDPPGTDPPGTDPTISNAVERFRLASMLQRNPHALSGGEKQRLALATLWLQRPQLLLLDEPTAYLDAEAFDMCVQFVGDLHSRGVTIVWATPGGEELTLAEEIVALDGGAVGCKDTIDGFLQWAQSREFEFVPPPARELAYDVWNALDNPSALDDQISATSVSGLADKLAQRYTAARGEKLDRPAEVAGQTTPAVELHEVCFSYQDDRVIDNITLAVPAGQIVGIAGANGAGKSTLLALCAGALRSTSGRLHTQFDHSAAHGRRTVFYLFQNPEQMFFAESVLEELAFGLRHLGVSEQDIAARAAASVEAAGLSPALMERSPFRLSLGEMRRVALAIALALEPEFLLLDEPTSCLDPAGKAGVLDVIRDHARRGGTAMIASHDVDFLVAACDRVLFMNGGRLSAEVDLSHGEMSWGEIWPYPPAPLILDLQQRLGTLGVPIMPPQLTPRRLAEKLTPNVQ